MNQKSRIRLFLQLIIGSSRRYCYLGSKSLEDDFSVRLAGFEFRMRLAQVCRIKVAEVFPCRDSGDMALRYGSPTDTNIYGFKICNVPLFVCATQEYIDKHGAPLHPHDLTCHNVLVYQLSDMIHDVWELSKDDTDFKIKVSANRASNDGDLVRRWCVAGQVVAAKSSLDMSEDLLNDRVVHVMPELALKSTELWLIFPSCQSITPAAQLLRDMLRKKIAEVLGNLVDKGRLDNSVLL